MSSRRADPIPFSGELSSLNPVAMVGNGVIARVRAFVSCCSPGARIDAPAVGTTTTADELSASPRRRGNLDHVAHRPHSARVHSRVGVEHDGSSCAMLRSPRPRRHVRNGRGDERVDRVQQRPLPLSIGPVLAKQRVSYPALGSGRRRTAMNRRNDLNDAHRGWDPGSLWTRLVRWIFDPRARKR